MLKKFSLEITLNLYQFNLEYARILVDDISEEKMYQSYGEGLENHPAFVLGHLTVASAMIIDDLDGLAKIPEGWQELFGRSGPGDQRIPEARTVESPKKNELLLELEKQHKQVNQILKNIEYSTFSYSLEWRFNNMLPSLGDYVTFMCITHEAMHLGQLSAWRRAAGLESSLARL